jgi:hypothetical protein
MARLSWRLQIGGRPLRPWRGIAQSGSAGVLGTPGRRFESCCPDQINQWLSQKDENSESAGLSAGVRPPASHRKMEKPSRCYPGREGLEGCGSVPASGVERIRTCEREGLCLSSRHSGVRAGRSKKYHANHRKAGDDVGLADLPVSRAPESGEAPRESLWPSG